MSPTSVWIWGIAAGVLLTGLAVITWALIGDRPRGRRRCPRCWYDMAGLPGLTCPECGRTPRRERGLLRSRRRWRWATAALLIMVLTITPVAVWTGRIGWGAVPTPMMIAIWPVLMERSGGLYARSFGDLSQVTAFEAEFLRRVRSGRLAGWEARWFARLLVGRLDPKAERSINVGVLEMLGQLCRRHDLTVVEPELLRLSKEADSWLGGNAFGIVCSSAAGHPERLLRLWTWRLENARTREVAWHAAMELSSLAAGADTARPVLLEMYARGDDEEVCNAAGALARVGPPDLVVPLLARSLGTHDEKLAACDAWTLRTLGPAADPAVPALIDKLLDRSLSDGGKFSASRNASAHSLGLIGGRAVGAIPALAAAPSDDERLCDTCEKSISQLGGDMDAGAAALLDMVRQHQITRRVEALRAVRLSGAHGPATLAAARSLLDDPDEYIRATVSEMVGSGTERPN